MFSKRGVSGQYLIVSSVFTSSLRTGIKTSDDRDVFMNINPPLASQLLVVGDEVLKSSC